MHVRLLGTMQVDTDNGAVAIAAAKERAVLARLALEVDRPVGLAELIDALWGDNPPDTAVKTVQNYVARLRRVLPPAWITSTERNYRLAIDKDAVDVAVFEREIAAARRATERGDHIAAASHLSEALTLWRGRVDDYFAEHTSAATAVARIEELRRTAEEDLAESRLALGGGADLVADIDALCTAEPLRERRWRQLMIAMYRAGRPGDALRAYQRARNALVEQLGIEPSEMLRVTERAVLDDDPALHHTPTVPALPAGIIAIAATPMAGRDEHLAAITTRWREVRGGARRAVILCGPAGIGKTRLTAEAAVRAHEDGALVLFGRCDRDGLVPYQPIVDAVRELTNVLPVVAADEPDGGSRVGRLRLFDAVVGVIDRLARARPVVLMLDDLQWVDRESSALLRYVLRALRGPVLLLATYRSGDEASASDVSAFVQQLSPEIETDVIDLAGLDRNAVRVLVGDEPGVADTVVRATGGSPLFITELLRFRSAHGRFPTENEVPVGVRAAVAQRIAQLPAHARRLLDAAAVAGEGAALAELATAAGLGELDAVDIVDRAIAADVLVDQPTAAGEVRFTHDLVRSAVLHGVSATRRAYLHRRVADVIIASGPDLDGRAAAIAHHLAAAGVHGDDVARWAAVAGAHASRQYAWDAAIQQFELALEHLPEGPTATRVDLLVRLADANRAAGMETPAKARFAEAVATARLVPDCSVLRTAVMRWTTVPVDIRRELADVISLLRATLDATPDDDSPDRAQLMARLAFSLGWAADADARPTADAAIAIARRNTDPTALARVLMYAGSTRDQFEAFDPNGFAGEMHDVTSRLNDPGLRCIALGGWIVGNVQRGRRAEADESLDELRTLATRHHLLQPSFDTLRLTGQLALLDGDIDTADRIAGELLGHAARTDLPNLFLFASSLLYDVRLAQGRLSELLAWFQRRGDTRERIPRVAAMRAQVLACAGQDDEAQQLLHQLTADGFAAISPPERPHSIATLADVACRLVDRATALALCAAMEPWSGLIVYDGTNGPLLPVDSFLTRLDAVATQDR